MSMKPLTFLGAGLVFGLVSYGWNGYCQEPAGESLPEPQAPPSQPEEKDLENTFEECQDGIDNDGDTYIDCKDQDCWIFAMCSQDQKPSPEKTEAAPSAPAPPEEGPRVEFVSDKPGVSIKKIVAEGYFQAGTASVYAMMTESENLTPCSFQLEKGTAQLFLVGNGAGAKRVRVVASDLLLTYKVRKNYPALFITGGISIGIGGALVLVTALTAMYKTKNFETGKKEPLLPTAAVAGMVAAGGALLLYGIVGMAMGIARAKRVK